MPVSLLPIAILLAAILAVSCGIVKIVLEKRALPGLCFVLLGGGLAFGPLLMSTLFICILWMGSMCGLPSWQFTLARALDSGTEFWGSLVVVPLPRFSEASLDWLNAAEANGSIAAKYAIGNRIYMNNKNSNTPFCVEITDKGKKMMQEAIFNGYDPGVDPSQYYFSVFRFQPIVVF